MAYGKAAILTVISSFMKNGDLAQSDKVICPRSHSINRQNRKLNPDLCMPTSLPNMAPLSDTKLRSNCLQVQLRTPTKGCRHGIWKRQPEGIRKDVAGEGYRTGCWTKDLSVWLRQLTCGQTLTPAGRQRGRGAGASPRVWRTVELKPASHGYRTVGPFPGPLRP